MLHFGKIPKKFGQIWRKFSKILAKFAKFWKKTAKHSAIFNENFEIRERGCFGQAPFSPVFAYGFQNGAWLLFRSRAPVVALGSKLLLPMRSSWPVFPGLDQDLFPHGFPRFLGFDSKTVQRSALCRSRRELSNAYLLAKFGFDTAENEPFQVCPLSAYRSPRCDLPGALLQHVLHLHRPLRLHVHGLRVCG